MPPIEYTSIRVPRLLLKEVQRFINEYPQFGHVSVPEYVRQGIRKQLMADLQYIRYFADDDFFAGKPIRKWTSEDNVGKIKQNQEREQKDDSKPLPKSNDPNTPYIWEAE